MLSFDDDIADVVGDDLDWGGLGPRPVDPNGKRRAALARAAQLKQRLAPQEPLGHLHDRPRVALPSVPTYISAGVETTICLAPQRIMRGPYWLGLTNAAHVAVTNLLFGQECVFNSFGQVPGAFFDVAHPEKLIPIAGRTLNLGMRVSITLRNLECQAIEVLATLWGNGVDFDDAPPQLLYRPDRAPVPHDFEQRTRPPCSMHLLGDMSLEALNAAGCPQCGQSVCGFQLAERYRRQAERQRKAAEGLETERQEIVFRAARHEQAAADEARRNLELARELEVERERVADLEAARAAQTPEALAETRRVLDFQSRRDADSAATFAHTEPYEPGEVWETACDDSD